MLDQQQGEKGNCPFASRSLLLVYSSERPPSCGRSLSLLKGWGMDIKKMSVFTNRKSRDLKTEPAWIEVSDTSFGGTTYKVIKNNQADTLAQYATCFLLAVSAYTGSMGDMGDTYWAQVYAGDLVKVDGREPTDIEAREWLHLKSMAGTDPLKDFFG